MSQAPRERLNRLLDLASRGPAGRAALLDELADLLLDWPADYAIAMRGPFEALFEKTAREVDTSARAAVAERIEGHEELPLALLNEFYFEASPKFRARILALNDALECDSAACGDIDAPALVEAARTMNGAFKDKFSDMLSLPPAVTKDIFSDASGQSLAVTCSGAGLDRAAFSAIALLIAPDPARLAHFDTIPQAGAEQLLAFWRARA